MAKILLVEDDKSLREIYGVRLLAEGYDIVSAGDGEEALAMAIKERPDLIVSDVMMPKISGFDMLDILRSTTETKNIKVIMMTALSSEDQRQRGEQLGADRYLVKSQVGIEDVVRTVHDVLADAPTASAPPVQVPAPAPQTPQPRPATTPVPARPYQPASPQTASPMSTGQPVASPAAPQQAATFAPQPVSPPESALPQPTAPFSTPRPAGLADRIIQPLDQPEELGEPIASLMDKELGQFQAQPSESPVSQAPTPQQAPSMQPSQSPVQATPPPTVTPQTAPQPSPLPNPAPPINPNIQQPSAPVQPPSPVAEDHGISFEETPRQAS